MSNKQQSRILFITGAGLSAESGIPTFRDKDGLWDQYDIDVVCNYRTMDENREQVFEFYNRRRQELEAIVPNKAHQAIADLQNEFGLERVRVITQNVDDLLERAGCSDVLHVHGELTKMMCEACNTVWEVGYRPVSVDTLCPECASEKTKPAVVLFHEQAPLYPRMYQVIGELSGMDSFVVIGTSGSILPITILASVVSSATHKILCNLEKTDEIEDRLFDQVLFGRVTEKIEQIISYCRKRIED